MTTLVNSTLPYLRILMGDGSYQAFVGGRLEIAEDDPYHGEVMAEASRNASIAVLTNETTCIFCGEVYRGDKAAGKLDEHQKANHFDLWVKQREIAAATVIQREIKARAGFACDICQPLQTFGTEGDLAEHANTFHATPPDLDAEGNTIGGSRDGDDTGRPGEVAPPAAATRSRRSAPAGKRVRARPTAKTG